MKLDISQYINKYQIVIGMAVLVLGTLVYLVDRPPDQTYFVSESKIDISLHDTLPTLYGRIGNSLPTFSHVFAFILITAGLLNCRRKGYLIITICWFITDSAFEFGQKFSDTAVKWVPSWFSGIPYLENTESYFRRGTFDWIDIATIFLGSVSAYVVLRMTVDMGKKSLPC